MHLNTYRTTGVGGTVGDEITDFCGHTRSLFVVPKQASPCRRTGNWRWLAMRSEQQKSHIGRPAVLRSRNPTIQLVHRKPFERTAQTRTRSNCRSHQPLPPQIQAARSSCQSFTCPHLFRWRTSTIVFSHTPNSLASADVFSSHDPSAFRLRIRRTFSSSRIARPFCSPFPWYGTRPAIDRITAGRITNPADELEC